MQLRVKKLLLIGILISLTSIVYSQTAMDFTANDCKDVPHNLFSELNAGKVIVICWVMPCSNCAGPALTTYNVVNSLQNSNKDKVYMYLCDDYANTACSSLSSWATSIGINANPSLMMFSNNSIKMSDYLSSGMPKIVVLGGINHTVHYNVNNTVNSTELQKAINSALTSASVNQSLDKFNSVRVSPNPASSQTDVIIQLKNPSEVNIDILDLTGQVISHQFSGKLAAGENIVSLAINNLSSGMYLIKISDGHFYEYAKVVVNH